MTERQIILIDVDHTLSCAGWRDHLLGQWDAYHAAAKDDRCATDVAGLISALYSHHWGLVGLTSRPERFRQLTMEWLLRHQIKLDDLLMRPDDCYAASPDLKIRLLEEQFGPDWASLILFVLDDRSDVISRFLEHNVTCLQVHGRSY